MTKNGKNTFPINDLINKGLNLSPEDGLLMAERHIELLFGRSPVLTSDGIRYIELLLVWKDKETVKEQKFSQRSFFFSSADEAKSALPVLFAFNMGGYDLYIGPNYRTRQRSKNEDILGYGCVWSDGDVTQQLGADEIASNISGLPLAPSFQVVSGPTGGRHPYLLSKELLPNNIGRALVQNFGVLMGAKDNVSDPRRLLRLAGSLNNKPEYADHPFRAVLVDDEEVPIYSRAELEEAFGDKGGLPQPDIEEGKLTEVALPLLATEDNTPTWLTAFVQSESGSAALDRALQVSKESSPSEADLSFGHALRRSYPVLSEAMFKEAILWLRKHHGGTPEKALRVGYVKQTFEKLTSLGGEQRQNPPTSLPDGFLERLNLSADLTAADFETEWLIEGILPAGVLAILGAQTQMYKTFLEIHAALCVATGEPFLGRFAVKRSGPVVLVLAEDDKRGLMSRVLLLAKGMGIGVPTGLDIFSSCRSPFQLDNPAHVAALKLRIRGINPVLICLDPLRRLHRGKEDESFTANTLIDALFELRDVCGSTVVVAHHTRKLSYREPWPGIANMLRGSTHFASAADSLLGLYKKKGPNGGITTEVTHRNAPSLPNMVISVQDGDGQIRFSVEDGSDGAPRESFKVRTRVLLKMHKEGLKKDALAKRLGGRREETLKEIDALMKEGFLRKHPDTKKDHGARLVLTEYFPIDDG